MDYYKKTDHNIDTKNYLHNKSPKYIDWEVTTLFYAALHLVNNYFKKNNIMIPEKHGKMLKILRQLSNLSKISNEEADNLYECYYAIFLKSIDARYRPNVEISDADLKNVKESFDILKSILTVDSTT